MAQFSIDINDEMCEKVWDAFAFRFQYEKSKLADESKEQFARRMVIEWIKDVVINSLGQIAANDAKSVTEENSKETLIIQ